MECYFAAFFVCTGLACAATVHTLAGNIDIGKIRALDSPDRIPNDFLVVMNANQKTEQSVLQDFTRFLHRYHPRVRIEKAFIIRDFIALRLHIPDIDVEAVARNRDVKFLQSNLKVYASSRYGVSCEQQDTAADLWGLSRIGDRTLPDYNTAEYVWLSGDGRDVDAYVIDTGVRTTHEDFSGRATHGFTASSIKQSGEGDDDLNGHGTHVAGTIAGGTYGVAKNANIIAVKVLNGQGSGTTADVIEGIEFVHKDFIKKQEKGKKPKSIVNMSLGGRPFAVGGADEAAIVAATADGLTFVVAAGNDAYDTCFVSPARISSAITVGASDQKDALAYFSNHGPCVDIVAPGVSILSAGIESDTDSSIKSGTSMAAPHVAGVVARYLSQIQDSPTPASVKAWVQNAATGGAIDLGEQVSTPNDLLFMACEAETSTLHGLKFASPSTHSSIQFKDYWIQFSEDEAWIYVSVMLAIIVALTFIGCLLNCCILCKTNNVLKAIPKHEAHAQGPQQTKGGIGYDNARFNQGPVYGESTKLLA